MTDTKNNAMNKIISEMDIVCSRFSIKEFENTEMNKHLMRIAEEEIKDKKDFKITVHTKEYDTILGTEIRKDMHIEDI